MKKNYRVFIKSHGEYPDFDMELEAKSFKQAVCMFTDVINRGSEDMWSEKDIAECVAEVE